MQQDQLNRVTPVTTEKKPLSTKIIIAWLLAFVALSAAGLSGRFIENSLGLTGIARYGTQALIMSGIILPGIWLLRSRFDRGNPRSIGIGNWRTGLKRFALGISLLAFPLILAMSCAVIFGWGTVHINTNDSTLWTLITGIAIAFTFEALPEELAFRGYIYSNLNVKFKRWVSALATTALFVLLPVLLVPFQKYVLGMEIVIGNARSITMEYIITMVLFGAFVQYLRILTDSIWTGIGFHLFFVYINRVIGPDSTDLIQLSGVTSETPLQILFGGSLILIFIALLVYPLISKNKIGWKEVRV